MSIIKYQKEVDRKEFERLADEKAKREEREREVQKLREQQEKVADRQAEIDAIRARRAMEDYDRNVRLKEKLEKEKKERMIKDLDQARTDHFKYKERVLLQETEKERE